MTLFISVIGIGSLMGCSQQRTKPKTVDKVKHEQANKAWHYGEWVLDPSEMLSANKGHPMFESQLKDGLDLRMHLETSLREVMIAEQLSEDNWDTARMVVLGVSGFPDKAIFRVYEGPQFVLYRSEKGVYFVEPNGIKVCFQPK